jgi:hypothetical protein
MKTCSRCNTPKPSERFPKAPTCKDGRRSYCSKCHTEKRRLARQNHPEQMETARLASLRWAEANRERSRELKAKWRKNNQEACIEIGRSYRQRNKDKVKADTNRRRKKFKRATYTFKDKEWFDLFMSEVYSLAQTRERETGFKWHVDHIIPLVHDKVCGLHTPHNIQLLPASVNMSKSNKYTVQ